MAGKVNLRGWRTSPNLAHVVKVEKPEADISVIKRLLAAKQARQCSKGEDRILVGTIPKEAE